VPASGSDRQGGKRRGDPGGTDLGIGRTSEIGKGKGGKRKGSVGLPWDCVMHVVCIGGKKKR